MFLLFFPDNRIRLKRSMEGWGGGRRSILSYSVLNVLWAFWLVPQHSDFFLFLYPVFSSSWQWNVARRRGNVRERRFYFTLQTRPCRRAPNWWPRVFCTSHRRFPCSRAFRTSPLSPAFPWVPSVLLWYPSMSCGEKSTLNCWKENFDLWDLKEKCSRWSFLKKNWEKYGEYWRIFSSKKTETVLSCIESYVRFFDMKDRTDRVWFSSSSLNRTSAKTTRSREIPPQRRHLPWCRSRPVSSWSHPLRPRTMERRALRSLPLGTMTKTRSVRLTFPFFCTASILLRLFNGLFSAFSCTLCSLYGYEQQENVQSRRGGGRWSRRRQLSQGERRQGTSRVRIDEDFHRM